MSPAQSPTLGYQPALDGTRAVSVALVLAFHAGFGWVTGGYLGVSVFFTLSGFLITRLLLAELARTGGIRVAGFYGRRLARLAPASMLCLVGVMVARWAGAFAKVPHLRADVTGAALQVFNWVKLSGHGSYADLFVAGTYHTTSPLEHYWSLAIEEQFYWLWPLALCGLVRWHRRRVRGDIARRGAPLASIAVVTLAFVAAAPLVAAVWGTDAAYWATPARLAEILVGATLAAWTTDHPRVPRAVRLAGPAALAAIVVLSLTTAAGSGFAYHGGLPAFALLSALLIWSLQAEGRLQRVLGHPWLAAVGRVSYGLYLFHWPIDTLLRERGWHLDTAGGFATATGITVIVTVASYRLLERPVRTAGWQPGRLLPGAALATVAVLVVVAFVPGSRPLVDVDEGLLAQAAIRSGSVDAPLVAAPESTSTTTALQIATSIAAAGGSTSTSTSVVASTTTAAPGADPVLPPRPSRPVRVLVVGDSTAIAMTEGLAAWAIAHPGYLEVTARWCPGCGFLLDGTITSWEATTFVRQSADVLQQKVPEAVRQLHPDLVVMMSTVNDVANRRWSAAEGVLTPEDAAYRARLDAAYRGATDFVLALGVPKVAWILPPTPFPSWPEPEMRDPRRWQIHLDVIRGAVASHPHGVSLIDLDAWMSAIGELTDLAWRPDGVHLTRTAATDVAGRFLVPAMVRTALDDAR